MTNDENRQEKLLLGIAAMLRNPQSKQIAVFKSASQMAFFRIISIEHGVTSKGYTRCIYEFFAEEAESMRSLVQGTVDA